MILLRRFKPSFLFSSSQPTPKFNDFQLQKLISQPNPLKQLIKTQLSYTNNQMKLSSYWDLCLTHPQHGFYSQKNVFSKDGHFTTSPQISSIFGQIFGVWIMHFIQNIAKIYPDTKPNKKNQLNLRPFRLIQFGPGRGLFMADILRCIAQLDGLDFLQSVTMIETSAENTKLQQKSLLDQLAKRDKHFGFLYNYTGGEIFKGQNNQIELKWFKNLFQMSTSQKQFMKTKELAENQDKNLDQTNTKSELPPFTIILAHQFFDALPTQSLIYTQNGWKERVVSLDETDNLVLKPSANILHDKFIPMIQNPQIGDTVQISPQSLMLMETLSQLISQNNGCILNIDYGNAFAHSDSIRAIKSHKFVPYPEYLNLPGLCDLSAYVDFASLQQFAQRVQGIKGFGPIPQGLFLQSMGINLRIQVLSKGKSQEVKNRMQQDYERLVSPQKMGEIYKVQMITCKDNQEVYPFLTQDKQNVF